MTIRNAVSRLLGVLAGVPQGSILGPLLFLVFIDDLAKTIETYIRLFTDDTSMLAIGRDHYKCSNRLQSSLDRFTLWASSWKVAINPAKMEVVTFCRNEDHTAPLFMLGTLLQEQEFHKHIGLTFQKDLRWNTHVDNIIAQAESKLSVLSFIYSTFLKRHLEQCTLPLYIPSWSIHLVSGVI